jgi:hypothetical protein
MGVIVFANPTAMTWGGVAQTLIRSFSFSQAESETVDVTYAGSLLFGTGVNARIEKSYDTVTIEPVSLTVEVFGYPLHAMGTESWVGRTEMLSFTTPSGVGAPLVFNHLATLRSWVWNSNNYNQPATGYAEFFLAGA